MKHSQFTAAKKAAVFVVLTTTFFTANTLGQVDIVESQPIIRPTGQLPGVAPAGQAGASNALDELFQQIQSLQLLVQEQTGLIEELSYEVSRLKQQRLDDYVDLDRRISELSQGGVVTTAPPANSPTGNVASANPPRTATAIPSSSAPSTSPANAPSLRDETAAYRAASDLIDKKQWDQAIAALQNYLASFPNGRYESNAHYWLGELFFVKGDLANARDSFELVMAQFPNSNKFHASQYKLGRTYFRLGDTAKAKNLLEELAASNSDSSRQAAVFLRENF